jgi:hypothetical protein
MPRGALAWKNWARRGSQASIPKLCAEKLPGRREKQAREGNPGALCRDHGHNGGA